MKRCCKRAQKFMNRHAAKILCAGQDRPAIGATSTPSPSTQTRLNQRSPKPPNRLLDSIPSCDNWLDSFRLWDKRETLRARKADIQVAYRTLVEKRRESGELTGSANTAADIRKRIGIFRELFAQFA